jgi:hypothetical protein
MRQNPANELLILRFAESAAGLETSHSTSLKVIPLVTSR